MDPERASHSEQELLDSAVAAHRAGNLPLAEDIYRQILARIPNHADALHLLGVLQHQRGRTNQAVELITRAIQVHPQHPDFHFNLALVLQAQGSFDEAIVANRQAIQCRPDFAEAHNNLGLLLGKTGLLDQGIDAYRSAIVIRPSYRGAHSNLVMALHYQPRTSPAMILAESKTWAARHTHLLEIPRHAFQNVRDPHRPLRIGYVSADFRDHASALFLLPLFRHHNQNDFHLTAYAELERPDAVTEQMRQHFRQWRITAGVPDKQLAATILEDQIDILVDLKLHTECNRLGTFAYKPAPVQATWLGYPGTTGLSTIDYRLTDPYLDPPDTRNQWYTEKSLRFADCFWCYDPLDGAGASANDLPLLRSGHCTFGCLNNFWKVNDSVLELWAEILRQNAKSTLLLLAPRGSARDRTSAAFTQRGIDASRIEFADRRPRMEYLEYYHRIDLILDTFPYAGHTTSFDALWMGVPFVTLPGETAVSRAGLSLLANIGLIDLVASSSSDYVHRAVALSQDAERLSNLRSTLRTRMQSSVLMDAPLFARRMEAAFRQMWQEWCKATP